MLTFFMLLNQVTSILLGIYILSNNKLGLKLFIMMILLSQFVAYPLFNLVGTIGVFLVLGIFIIFLFIKTKKLVVNITITFVTLLLAVISDYTAQVIVLNLLDHRYVPGKNIFIFQVVASATITVFTCFLMKQIFNKLQVYKILNTTHGKLFLGFVSCTVAIFYADIFIGQILGFTREMIFLRGTLFLFYTLLLIVLFIVFSGILAREMKIEREKIKMESEKIQAEQLSDYVAKMEEFYEEMRSFRHDYQNILLGLSEYVRTNDIIGLQEYYSKNIESLHSEMQFNNYKLGQLKNLQVREIKGIIASKIIKAQELKIDTVVEVFEPIDDIMMNMVDLCRILGIILDNAIEEVVEIEGGKLQIVFIKDVAFVEIVISNSCREQLPLPSQMYKRGFSTKGKDRGLGLSNLDNIVERIRNVELETDISNGMFTQQVKILKGK